MSVQPGSCKIQNNPDTIDLVIFENKKCVLFNLDGEIIDDIKRSLEAVNSHINRVIGKQRDIDETESEPLETSYDENKCLIRFRNFAGFVFHRNLRIWFVPKVFKNTNVSNDELITGTIKLMYHMLTHVKEEYRRVSRTIFRRRDPCSFLSELYVNTLNSEFRRGVYKEYVRFTGGSSYVRGKPLVPESIKKYPYGIQKPVSQFWLLSINNSLNKVFYVATEKALGFIESRSAKSQAVEIINLLENAKEHESLIPAIIPLVKFNRLNERFRETFFLATMILGYTGVLGREALVFIQNMPELFERYIYRVLKRRLRKLEVKYQHEVTGSICCVDNVRKARVSYPDIVVKTQNGFVPIDVKYKVIESCDDVPMEDIYQMAFYSRLLNSKRAVLVYPSMSSCNLFRVEIGRGENIEYRKDVVMKDLDIFVVRYNFSSIIDKNGIDNGFTNTIEEILTSNA